MEKFNAIFVKHHSNGKPDLYAAIVQHGVETITVCDATINDSEVLGDIWGGKYTLEYIQSKMQDRKHHNFITFMGTPCSYPIDEKRIAFE